MPHGIAARRLIDAVYSAVLGRTSWLGFLEEARSVAPEGRALLLHRDARSGRGAFSTAAGLDHEAGSAFSAYYAPLNPMKTRLVTRPVGQVLHSDDMLPRAEFERTEFYEDFLRPRGIGGGFGATLVRDGYWNFTFGVWTPVLPERDMARVRRRIGALVPHLQRAFAHVRRRLEDRAAAPRLPRLRGGLMRIGRGARILTADDKALGILERTQGPVTIDRGGRLVFSDPAVTTAVEGALSEWIAGRPLTRTLLLRRGQGLLPLKLTIIRHGSADESFLRGPECLLVIEDPGEGLDAAVEAFGDMHGLTAAERRIVLGLVEGRTPAEIAADTAVTADTVRLHIKNVFARAGLNRQVDIVRHVCLLDGAEAV